MTIAHELIQYDDNVQAEWDRVRAREQEILSRLDEIDKAQRDIEASLGRIVAERQDWKKHAGQLADLKAERSALKAGLEFLSGRAEVLKRNNYWLVVSS